MSYTRSICAAGLAVLALLSTEAGQPTLVRAADPVTVTDYTDPGEALDWATRSHWKQPWRSYLDTVPATTFLDAIGINFNVAPQSAKATATLLARSGFKRARIEVGWNALDYDNPNQMTANSRQSLATTLAALRENGLRPLIVLNSNHGLPCPWKESTVTLTAKAGVGAARLQLTPASAGKIVLGRTGVSSNGVAANSLITSIDSKGVATLSKPLKEALPTGPLEVVTLRYQPFSAPKLLDGTPNPRFEQTLGGWLAYAGVVTREAKAMLGSDQFDVEIWNELTFGSNFLNIENYYEPDIEPQEEGANEVIRDRTVAYLRQPARGLAGIGIGNGFSNTTPWASGGKMPPGLTAIDKHPYTGPHLFPQETAINGSRPLDGLGELAGLRDLFGQWHELFTPTYKAFFPEYSLSAIQPETLVRDIAPYVTLAGTIEHGRFTHPPGAPAPTMWVTEMNLDPAGGTVVPGEMSAADIRYLETKNVLRILTSYVNKGITLVDLYAATRAGNMSVIDQGFYDALSARPDNYPGDAPGGGTTDAVRRLTASMHGAAPIAEPRQLSLRELTDYAGKVQFTGNGTEAYPPLYNRDVFAFLPFQVNSHRFVIPVYVMTRDVAEDYRPGAPAGDPTRFDLPPERYRMAIGGIDGTEAVASATDPLTGQDVPVQVTSSSEDEIVVEMDATDSPRLLTIEEEPQAEPEPEPKPEPEEPQPVGPQALPEARPAVHPPPAANGSKLGLAIRARGAEGLLKTGHMSVFAKCDRPCAVSFGGSLRVGRRAFEMTPREAASLPASQAVEAGTRLSLNATALRAARRALDHGLPVRVHLDASAADDSGAASATRRIKIRP